MINKKKELRKKYKEKEKVSLDATHLLIKLLENLSFKSMAMYFPLDREIGISSVFKRFKESKDIYFPFMKKENGCMNMEFRKYSGIIVKDDYNIKSSSGRKEDSSKIDLFLVPAIAYNKKGYRLGRGMGFYDKALKGCKALKIGLCLSEDIVDIDFEEEHDLKVDYIVTEKEIIKVK